MVKKLLVILKQLAIGLCVSAATVASAVGVVSLVKHKKNTAESDNRFVFVKNEQGLIQKIELSKVIRNVVFLEDCMRHDSSVGDTMITNGYKPLNAVADFIKCLKDKPASGSQKVISDIAEMETALGGDFCVENVKSIIHRREISVYAINKPIKIFDGRREPLYKEACLDYIVNNADSDGCCCILLQKGETFSVILGVVGVSVGDECERKLIYYQPDLSPNRIFLYDTKKFQDDFFSSDCKNSISAMYLVKEARPVLI